MINLTGALGPKANDRPLERVLEAVTKGPVKGQQEVTFSIPASHPRAPMLIQMMKGLQTATVTRSGIHLQHRGEDQRAVEEMLTALHSVLTEEGVEVEPLDVLVQKQKIQPLTLPQLFGTVMQALGGSR